MASSLDEPLGLFGPAGSYTRGGGSSWDCTRKLLAAVREGVPKLVNDLGFQVKDSKCIAPCQTLIFLGVIINVLENSVQLEESRCQKYLSQLRELMAKVKEKDRI